MFGEGWVTTRGLTAPGLCTVAEPRFCVRAGRGRTGLHLPPHPRQLGGPPCLGRWARRSCRSRGGSLEVGSARDGGGPWGGAPGAGRASEAASFQFFVQSRDSPSLLSHCATPRPRIAGLSFPVPPPPIPLGRNPSCAVQVMRTVGGITLLGQFSCLPDTVSQREGWSDPALGSGGDPGPCPVPRLLGFWGGFPWGSQT